MSNKEGENMQQDLSNARIIEWEHGGETYVASRRVKGQVFGFIAPTGAVRTATEFSLQNPASEVMNLRVVAEFPAPSLAEIVGGAPLDAYEAHVLAREAHEAAEEQQRQLDAAALTDVYALIRAAAGRGEMHLLWTPARCANFPRRREFVTRALRRAGYGVTTASDGARIEWTAAPPEAAEGSEVVS